MLSYRIVCGQLVPCVTDRTSRTTEFLKMLDFFKILCKSLRREDLT